MVDQICKTPGTRKVSRQGPQRDKDKTWLVFGSSLAPLKAMIDVFRTAMGLPPTGIWFPLKQNLSQRPGMVPTNFLTQNRTIPFVSVFSIIIPREPAFLLPFTNSIPHPNFDQLGQAAFHSPYRAPPFLRFRERSLPGRGATEEGHRRLGRQEAGGRGGHPTPRQVPGPEFGMGGRGAEGGASGCGCFLPPPQIGWFPRRKSSCPPSL